MVAPVQLSPFKKTMKPHTKLGGGCFVTYNSLLTIWAYFYSDYIIKGFSKHWPSGPILSISRHVRPCPSVRVFTFEVPFKHLFAPTWVKVMERSGLRFESFY